MGAAKNCLGGSKSQLATFAAPPISTAALVLLYLATFDEKESYLKR